MVDVGAVARERLVVGGEHVGAALGDELRLARGLGFGCLLAHAGGFEGQGRRCRLALDAGHEVGLRARRRRGGGRVGLRHKVIAKRIVALRAGGSGLLRGDISDLQRAFVRIDGGAFGDSEAVAILDDVEDDAARAFVGINHAELFLIQFELSAHAYLVDHVRGGGHEGAWPALFGVGLRHPFYLVAVGLAVEIASDVLAVGYSAIHGLEELRG